jgi:hypothetical protein
MAEIKTEVVERIVNIIDVVSRRGAFEGAELSLVGQIRQILVDAAQADRATQAMPPELTTPKTAPSEK